MYTLQDYRDLPRSLLDLDVSDISDALIDSWVREGDSRIVRAKPNWRFREGTWSLVTEPSVSSYTIASAIGSDVEQIVSIQGAGSPLKWIGQDLADQNYASSTRTGSAEQWSEWAGQVTLYPIPVEAETLTVRGYKKREDWVSVGAGSEPPYDDELQGCLLNWVYGKAYAQQEDPDTSVFYLDLFDNELQRLAARKDTTPPSQLLVLGGARRHGLPDRLRFPWEG